MAMKMEKVAAIPAGNHTGIITRCHETTKSFDGGRTAEPVVEIVIAPKWEKPGHRTLPVSCVVSPQATSLSALGRLLERIGVHLEDGQEFVPASIEGTEVSFTTKTKPDGFVVLEKDTIRKAA